MLMSYEAKVKNLEAALLELCNDAGVPSVAKLKEFILNSKKEPGDTV